MRKASAPSAESLSDQNAWTTRTAWWTLLFCVAVLPLTTAVTVLGSGSSWTYISDAFHLPKLLLLTVLMSIATLAWLADVVFAQRKLRTGIVLAPLAVFAVLATISTVFAYEPLSSLFGASMLSTGTVTWLLCAWLALLISQYVTSGARLVGLSWAVVGGCTVVALTGLLQAAGADPLSIPVSEGLTWMVRQGSSTLGNPDYTALLLIVPTVLAVALAMSERIAWRRWTAAACAVAMAGALFITLTRAGWLGAAVALIAFVALGRNDSATTKRLLVWIGAGALGMAALAYALLGTEAVSARFALLKGGLDSFTSGRVTLWGDALRIMAAHPLLGTGADRLGLGAYEVQRELVIEGSTRYVLQDPHNAALLVGGMFGIPALLALLAYVAMVVWAGWRAVRDNTGQSRGSIIYLGWFAGLLGLVVAALFSVWTITAVFVLFLTLAVVASPKLKGSDSPHGMTYAIVLGVLALVLVGTSLYGTVSMFRAERHITLSKTEDSKTHLEAAMALMPWDAMTRVEYLSRKIGSYEPVLTSPTDVAGATKTAAGLDSEVKLAITEFRHELLFYRLRVHLYEVSEGQPGYQPDMVLEALDRALKVFPNDPEFTAKREALLATQD